MRMLSVIEFLSLDGVMQAPGSAEEDTEGGFRHGGWQRPYFDEVLAAAAGEGMAATDSYLFGRKTYEGMAAYWPTVSDDDPYARSLNRSPKYVASRTLRTVDWQNSTLLSADVAQEVTKLKQQSGKNIAVLGSGELVQTLVADDLVDEYFLGVFPIVLGGGKRLFREADQVQEAEPGRLQAPPAPVASSSPTVPPEPGTVMSTDVKEGTEMKHYLLSLYQPDGDPPAPEVMATIMRELDALNQELKRAGAWVFAGGLHAPSTATVVRAKNGDLLTTDGPYVEGKEHIGGFTIIKAPDLDAALGWAPQAHPGGDHAGRSRCDPSKTKPSGWTTRAPSLAGSEIERVFREEHGRAVAVLVRVFGDIDVAEEGGGKTPSPWRRSAGPRPVSRRARRPGSSPPPATGRSTGSGGRHPAKDGTRRQHCCRRAASRTRRTLVSGRQAAPDLHLLLPSCARPQRPGRAHAAPAGWAHHRGDRLRLPRRRAGDGPAPGAGQGQDPRRTHPLPSPERRRPARPPAGRSRRRLSDLQRGPHRQLRRPAHFAGTSAPRRFASAASSTSSCPTNQR